MSKVTEPRWMKMRTAETRQVEEALRRVFRQVDAYRYNPASIRVRVVDPRFEGKKSDKRDAIVEKYLKTLPEEVQADILNLLTFAPHELEDREKYLNEWLLNTEFEDPSRSML